MPRFATKDLRQISKWLIQAERQQITRLRGEDCEADVGWPGWLGADSALGCVVGPAALGLSILDSSLAVDFSAELDAGKRNNANSDCEGCRYKN